MEAVVTNLPQSVLIVLAIFVSAAYILRTSKESLDILGRKTSPHSLISELQYAMEASKQAGNLGYAESQKLIDTYIKKVINHQLDQEVRIVKSKIYRGKLGTLLDVLDSVAVYIMIALQIVWVYWVYVSPPLDFTVILNRILNLRPADFPEFIPSIVGVWLIAEAVVLLKKIRVRHIRKRIEQEDRFDAIESATGAINNGSMPRSYDG